jgi:hypothetical protein
MTVLLSGEMIVHRMTVGMSLMSASTERQQSDNNFSLIYSAIKGLRRHINQMRSYRPALDVKWQATYSLTHPRHERQRSVTDS